jgi:hypothetical protein
VTQKLIEINRMKKLARHLEELDSDCSRDLCKTAVLGTARTLTKIFYKLPSLVRLFKSFSLIMQIFLRNQFKCEDLIEGDDLLHSIFTRLSTCEG